MNVIFLDMDGVLNSMNSINQWIETHGPIDKDNVENRLAYREHFYEGRTAGYTITPENRETFNRMFSQIPDCKVVWSTTWRRGLRNSKRFIEGLYNQCGLPEKSFLGFTPIINGERHVEIESWLNTFAEQYNVKKAVILDDDYDAEILGGKWNDIPVKFFQTDFNYGLTDVIATKVVVYFNSN